MRFLRKSLIALGTFAAAGLPVALSALPPASAWEIGPFIRGRDYSVGMPRIPVPGRSGGWYFDFPYPSAEAGHVHYLTYPSDPLANASRIVIRYRIDAPHGTRFVPQEQQDKPAMLSLFFQQRGDTWSGRGRYNTYRWYSVAMAPVTPGEHSLTVRLDDPWTPVNGGTNSGAPAGFAAAKADTGRVGFVLGSAGLRGHGVFATAPARFTLIAFDVE